MYHDHYDKTDRQRSELRMVGTVWFLSSVSGSVDVSIIGLSAIADSPQFSMLPVGKATRFCWAPVCCSSDWGSILAAAVAAVVVFIWDGEIGYKERRKPASTSNIDGSMGYHLINGLLTSEQNFQFVPTYLSVTSKLKRIVVNCICLQIEQSAWISENSKQKSVKLWASNRKVNSSFTSIELLQCLYERHCYCVQPRQQCLQGGTSAVCWQIQIVIPVLQLTGSHGNQ